MTGSDERLVVASGLGGWLPNTIGQEREGTHRRQHLSHWGRDKMTAVSQTTLSNGFSWMKMLEFRRFHWSLFLGVQLTIIQHWFRQWLGAGQTTSHYLNQWCLVYWRIYASLGLNVLTHWGRDKMEDNLQTTFSNAFSSMENARIAIMISLKFVPKGPIDNKSALVQVVAWRLFGAKPLPEPKMTQCNVYMRRPGSMS